MRYLVISDIHANLVAFETVLADAKDQYDKIWCLGDVVGYGPYPNECVELLNEFDHLCIAGNHDWGALNKLDLADFHQRARFAALWTQEQLKPENWAYLDNLPEKLVVDDTYTLVHGSPRYPIWEYIVQPPIAHLNFPRFFTPYCLVGHTHVPVVFLESENPNMLCDTIRGMPEVYTHHFTERRVIINPGSVGQPRDGDPRASYGLLDTEAMTFTIKRIPYDVNRVQRLMKAYDFPTQLWQRLSLGY
jgi:diadenosine tetraphosphatase ApaH/serine/threonine PP2A family protein phosphatase